MPPQLLVASGAARGRARRKVRDALQQIAVQTGNKRGIPDRQIVWLVIHSNTDSSFRARSRVAAIVPWYNISSLYNRRIWVCYAVPLSWLPPADSDHCSKRL